MSYANIRTKSNLGTSVYLCVVTLDYRYTLHYELGIPKTMSSEYYSCRWLPDGTTGIVVSDSRFPKNKNKYYAETNKI
jgi:hypothetical protein